MESWEQRLIYRYAGVPSKMTLLLDRDHHLPEHVELYVWKEAGLIAFVGTENGPYHVQCRDVLRDSERETIRSTRLGEYMAQFFPNSQKASLEAWFDERSQAVIAGERRQEEIGFDSRFQRVDLSALFRAKLLNTRESGQIKVCCSLPVRLSAARRGSLLELTADMSGPIECKPGHCTSYLSGKVLARLCRDWDGIDCWGRECVDGWVIGPNIIEVVHADPMGRFRSRPAAGASGDRLKSLPSLYRSFTLGQKEGVERHGEKDP